jgi:hypothetical protein
MEFNGTPTITKESKMNQMPPSSEETMLLVPMHLDALVVNESIRKMGITYNRWQMDYSQVNRFKNPMPNEFIGQITDPPPAGVHLHWVLPAGLTHGIEIEPGQIEYPFVPNRWLVVRIQSNPDASRPGQTAAWVLISDAYTRDPNDKNYTSPYIDPHGSQPGKVVPIKLGKKVALIDWQPKPDEAVEPFLTAIAPGNVTFAAFAPGAENIFAFYDDLSEIDDTRLTYLVVGWYSQSEKMDPLYHLSPDDWQSKFLFNISNQFEKELDQGKISDVLRQVFKDHEIDLSHDLSISKDQNGKAWRIKDGDLTYNAKQENNEIFVYESTIQVVEHLRWAAMLEGNPPPKRTLVHGLVYDVDWKKKGDLSKPINIPGVQTKQTICQGVRISVGNTSIDALTALINSQAKNAGLDGQIQPELLDAIQYDLLSTLDKVGSQTLLEQQIRQNWFNAELGGTLWQIVVKEQGERETGQEPPVISSEQESKLAKLNLRQRELDAACRILESMQWELYALWWKSHRIQIEDPRRYSQQEPGGSTAPPPKPALDGSETKTPMGEETDAEPTNWLAQILQFILMLLESLFGKGDQTPEPPTDQDEDESEPVPLPRSLEHHLDLKNPRSLASQVAAQKKIVDQLARMIPSGSGSEEDLEAWAKENLGLDPKKLLLKPRRMPRFWRPTDPVVLISGLGCPPKHGQDENLLCRLDSQIIDGISVPGIPGPLQGDDFTHFIPSLPHEHLPDCVHPLLKEAFFLDPGNAEMIAKNSPKFAVALEEVEKAILDLKPAHPDGTSVIGRYGALEWKQPWSPLFIDWQVSYYYTFDQQGGSFKKDIGGNFIFSRESWKFDGTDARWAGSEPSPQYRRSYSGRTFLTPHAPLNFLDRLKKVLQSQPNTNPKDSEAFLESIANWDILSQTISGFSDQLVLHDLDYTVTPYGDIVNLMDDQHQGIPFMTIVPDPGRGAPFFFPLRAGFLKFESLRVIDKFGRTLNLLYANNNPSGSEEDFLPIRGRGMIPDKVCDPRLVELSPRVVQRSRMNFRFVSAYDDRVETGLEVDSNPVCGWLLPNHIDKSISVYQADGDLLGELLLTTKSKAEKLVSWLPGPGSPDVSPAGNIQGEVRIANPHLKYMIEVLIHRNDQGTAFSDLLQVIDESLWTIDPLGPQDDENQAVLIGRPLALVRANLQLELCGKPFFNQAWVETMKGETHRLKENHGGLLDLDFPVRLGSPDLRNDGLIGYFQGTDYNLFHTVHSPTSLTAHKLRYINQIGAGDNYIKLKFRATTSAPFNPDGSVYLSLLIDPRGVIHANSGLLPTKIVELPARYFIKALEKMAITFRAGPLLLEPDRARLPLATDLYGDWTWIEAKGTKKGEWDIAPIMKTDTKAHFSTSPLNLVEGWLKFSSHRIDKKKEKRDEDKTS